MIAIPVGYAHFGPIHTACLINTFTFFFDSQAEIRKKSRVNYAALCSTIKLIEFEVFVLPISRGKWKVVRKRNLETPKLDPQLLYTLKRCYEESKIKIR